MVVEHGEIVEPWCGPVWAEFLLSLKYILDIEVNMYNVHLDIRVCESGECPLEKKISNNLDNLYMTVKHLDLIGIIGILP